MKNLFILLLLLSVATTGRSQSGCKNNWPADKAKAEEQLDIYTSALKQKNYRGAVPGIRWFLQNAPRWNTKLYIDATEVYNKLAASEKNVARKQVLIDSLLWLYDERIKYCGDQVAVLNRKAMSAIIYNGQNKDRTAGVLVLLDSVLSISGTNVSDNVLDNYFKIVYANYSLLTNQNADDIFYHRDKIKMAIEDKIDRYRRENKQSEIEKLWITSAKVDTLYLKMSPGGCDFHLIPNDVASARKIVELMPLRRCQDDALYLAAAETIYRLDPVKDFKFLKDLANKYVSMNMIDKAMTVGKQAVAAARNNVEKAEAFTVIGSGFGYEQKIAARDAYKQAGALDPQGRLHWEMLGDLYYFADDCKTPLVYLAAYDMYSKAGNPKKMAMAKQSFPSKAEIAALKLTKGQKVSTGCWVNENVVIETRD